MLSPSDATHHMNEKIDYTSRLCSTAAPMKEANSGCGSKGRDFSSGWNCTPMNQGWSGQLDDLGQQAVRRQAGEAQARGFELVAVAHVDLVAVAVALGDAGRAVDLGDLAALGEHRLIGAEPHRAAEIAVDLAAFAARCPHPFGHQADHRLLGRAELGRARAFDAGQSRAASITAICMPKQMPK